MSDHNLLLIAATAIGLSMPTAGAETPCFAQEFVPAAPETGDSYGHSVAIGGDTLVIGNDAADGFVTVYRWSGTSWVFEAELTSSFGQLLDGFGTSVAVSGEVIVVGAPDRYVGGNHSQGAATVFRWKGAGWRQEQELTSQLSDENDGFGTSVAVCGDVIVVGADKARIRGGTNAGSATIFRWDGSRWLEEYHLAHEESNFNDRFGAAVAVDGDVIAVGAPGDGFGKGSVTVYRRNGAEWLDEQVLSGGGFNALGSSVAVSGGLVIGGAPREDIPGAQDIGSARLYRWNGTSWELDGTLTDHEGNGSDWFGQSVALGRDVAVVGVPYDDVPGANTSGSAVVFRWTGETWSQEQRLRVNEPVFGDSFGYSVALDDERVAIGAPGPTFGGDHGKAYSFDLALGVASAEIVRLGVPPNSELLLPGVTTGPVVGATWDPVVDWADTGTFVLVAGAPANLPLGVHGTLLCELSTPPLLLEPASAPGLPIPLSIPNDCSFVGATLCVQGGYWVQAEGGALQPRLTNALDITIGTY